MKRRFFLLAAPAIVAAPSLMKVSALAMPRQYGWSAAEYARLHGLTVGDSLPFGGGDFVHLDGVQYRVYALGTTDVFLRPWFDA